MKIIDANKNIPVKANQAVLIDVFRATTSIVIMLSRNAKEIIPFENETKAREFFKTHKDYLLVGEHDGIKIEGFDYGNEPSKLISANLEGKGIIFVSTNGTRVLKSLETKRTIIASFLNADAVLDKITMDDPIVCANRKDLFCVEDFLCASYLKAKKLRVAIDFKRLKNIILNSKSAQRLRALNAEKDIEIALMLNSIPIVPVYEHGRIIL